MYFSISLSSTDPRLDFSSPIHTSPEDQCLSMTHFLTHLTYNGVSTSHEGAVPHTRVSILHGRDVPTLYSRCLDLSRGRHLHILLFYLLSICTCYSFPLSPLTHFNMRHYLGGAVHIRMRLPRHAIINSLFPARRSDESSIHDMQ